MIDKETINIVLSRTTLRQIEVMVTLQRHGSMPKAEEAPDMSVANVSRMAKRFENNLGVQIFAGDKRRSILLGDSNKLTDHLAALLVEINKLRLELRQIQMELRPIQNCPSWELRWGTSGLRLASGGPVRRAVSSRNRRLPPKRAQAQKRPTTSILGHSLVRK